MGRPSLCLMILPYHASASVTCSATAYLPRRGAGKTLQFTNDDGTPALMQIWLDINNPKSTPENADAPFVASPQIFRMNPHSGQMVRLSFVGQPLPRDRESLVLSQLPAGARRAPDGQRQEQTAAGVTNR
ncbi:fimbrial chaperone protein StbB [Serratia marcescens]|nr:fimbrial chaperone protein StbB [Serratia marcescens]